MAVSDALVVVEDWISEHYFTSEATKQTFRKHVLDRRKEWDADKTASTEKTGSPLARFTAERARVSSDLAILHDGFDPALNEELQDRLLAILGFTGAPLSVTCDGPLIRYATPGLDAPAPFVRIPGSAGVLHL